MNVRVAGEVEKKILITINEKETDAAEVMAISILKRDIVNLFQDYKRSRAGIWDDLSFTSMLFRNKDLTKQRIAYADKIIKYVNEFEGNKEQLLEGLKSFRIQNADVSRLHKKFHFNLLGFGYVQKTGERKYREDDKIKTERFEYTAKDIKTGQSSRESYLARQISEAIDMVEKRNVSPQIRNAFAR